MFGKWLFALLAPLALGGCGLWDDWFGTHKAPLPGKREPVVAGLYWQPGAV